MSDLRYIDLDLDDYPEVSHWPRSDLGHPCWRGSRFQVLSKPELTQVQDGQTWPGFQVQDGVVPG